MNKNKKVIVSIVAFLIAIILLMIGTLSYFTDRVEVSKSAKAGNVELEADFSNINLNDAQGQNIYNPGDGRSLSFSVTNKGNKSVDIRTKIKLTSSVKLTDENGQAEFDIYEADDVEYVEGEGYKPKENTLPIIYKKISDDGMSITYDFALKSILNGNMDLDEKETEYYPLEKGGTEQIPVNTDTHTYNFVLVMRGSASNEFQNANVKIDILVEAKQHRNTSAGWNIISEFNSSTDTDSGDNGNSGSEGSDDSGSTGIKPSTRKQVVDNAYSFLGLPIVWGGTSQNTGVDDSGLVYLAYSNAGYSIPRQIEAQLEWATSNGVVINSLSEALPGDLIFYNSNKVCIYIGNNQIIYAGDIGTAVQIAPVNVMPILKVVRVIN